MWLQNSQKHDKPAYDILHVSEKKSKFNSWNWRHPLQTQRASCCIMGTKFQVASSHSVEVMEPKMISTLISTVLLSFTLKFKMVRNPASCGYSNPNPHNFLCWHDTNPRGVNRSESCTLAWSGSCTKIKHQKDTPTKDDNWDVQFTQMQGPADWIGPRLFLTPGNAYNI